MVDKLENLLTGDQENPASNSETQASNPGVLRRTYNGSKRAAVGTYNFIRDNARVAGAVALGVPVAAAGAVVGKPFVESVANSLSTSDQFSTLNFPDNIISYGLGAVIALYAYGYFGAGLVRGRSE
jgi:hypothetical protein